MPRVAFGAEVTKSMNISVLEQRTSCRPAGQPERSQAPAQVNVGCLGFPWGSHKCCPRKGGRACVCKVTGERNRHA